MLSSPASLKQIRFYLLDQLRKLYSEQESAAISRMILEHSGYPRSLYLSDPEHLADPEAIVQINKILSDIHTGKPVQYILGYTDFLELSISVNEHVLIPRPETEELVQHILSAYCEHSGAGLSMIDLCTGSGAIALSLKQFCSKARVTGLDISSGALKVARINAKLNELEVHWLEADLLKPDNTLSEDKFDLIVSNPPYVRDSEKELMSSNVLNFEPHLALFVRDEDPLLFYRAIADFCLRHLKPGGHLWLEINEALGESTATLFKEKGFREVEIIRDIHEKERFIHAC